MSLLISEALEADKNEKLYFRCVHLFVSDVFLHHLRVANLPVHSVLLTSLTDSCEKHRDTTGSGVFYGVRASSRAKCF